MGACTVASVEVLSTVVGVMALSSEESLARRAALRAERASADAGQLEWRLNDLRRKAGTLSAGLAGIGSPVAERPRLFCKRHAGLLWQRRVFFFVLASYAIAARALQTLLWRMRPPLLAGVLLASSC